MLQIKNTEKAFLIDDIAKLTGPRITPKKSLWVCLCGSFYIRLSEREEWR